MDVSGIFLKISTLDTLTSMIFLFAVVQCISCDMDS